MANRQKSLRLKIVQALIGRKSLVPFLDPVEGIGFPTGGIGPDGYVDKQSQISAIKGWVYAANHSIVVPTASVKLELRRVDAKGISKVTTLPRDLEVLKLLNNPNLLHTGRQMRQLHFTYMNIVGESYILMLDRNGEPFVPSPGKLPSALQLLPAHNVQLKLGNTYNDSTVKVGNKEYPVTAVIRDFNPDPSDMVSGQSIVAAAASAIGTDHQMNEWNARLFTQGARPSMIYTPDQPLDDKAFNRLERQIKDQHTGLNGANGVMILENGKVAPWTMTQQDLDFLASRSFSRDEIFAMFNVSPGMVGQVENVNRANLEAGYYIHAVNNVVPRIEQYVEQINNTLVKVFDPNLELAYENPVPENVEAKLAAAEAGVDRWWTKDEVREMYGMEPLPYGEGEQIIVIAGKAGAMTLEEIISADPPAPTTSGTPANPEDPDNDSDDHLTESPSKSLDTSKKKDQPNPQPELTPVLPAVPELSDDEKETARQAKIAAKADLYNQVGDRYEQQILTTVRKQFEQQRQEVLSNFATVGIAGYGTKSYTRRVKKDYLDSLINWAKAHKDLAAAVAPLIYALIVETGKSATAALALDPSMFDPTTSDIMNYYQDRADKIAGSINDETEKQLRATLGQGTDNNESDDELQARIDGVFGAALTYRAARIGATETTNAQGFGDVAAWKQNGVVYGKEFACVIDERTCPFCLSLDGTIAALDTDFAMIGDSINVDGRTLNITYDDIATPPLHVSCRCRLLPVSIPLDGSGDIDG